MCPDDVSLYIWYMQFCMCIFSLCMFKLAPLCIQSNDLIVHTKRYIQCQKWKVKLMFKNILQMWRIKWMEDWKWLWHNEMSWFLYTWHTCLRSKLSHIICLPMNFICIDFEIMPCPNIFVSMICVCNAIYAYSYNEIIVIWLHITMSMFTTYRLSYMF